MKTNIKYAKSGNFYDIPYTPMPPEHPCFVLQINEGGKVIAGRWSGTGAFETPPAINARVHVNINRMGPGVVTAYFVEQGFIGIQVKLDKVPEYLVKQRKEMNHDINDVIHAFGAEIEPEKAKEPNENHQ